MFTYQSYKKTYASSSLVFLKRKTQTPATLIACGTCGKCMCVTCLRRCPTRPAPTAWLSTKTRTC